MSDQDLITTRAAQGPAVPTGANLVFTSETDGTPIVISIDELNVLLSGATVLQGRQDAYMGAVVKPLKTAQISEVALANGEVISWFIVERDTNDFYSVASPTQLTVPAGLGITKVRISAMFDITSPSSSDLTISLHKNGAAESILEMNYKVSQSSHLRSTPIDVVDGDYFEWKSTTAALDIDINSANSWTEIEPDEVVV